MLNKLIFITKMIISLFKSPVFVFELLHVPEHLPLLMCSSQSIQNYNNCVLLLPTAWDNIGVKKNGPVHLKFFWNSKSRNQVAWKCMFILTSFCYSLYILSRFVWIWNLYDMTCNLKILIQTTEGWKTNLTLNAWIMVCYTVAQAQPSNLCWFLFFYNAEYLICSCTMQTT